MDYRQSFALKSIMMEQLVIDHKTMATKMVSQIGLYSAMGLDTRKDEELAIELMQSLIHKLKQMISVEIKGDKQDFLIRLEVADQFLFDRMRKIQKEFAVQTFEEFKDSLKRTNFGS